MRNGIIILCIFAAIWVGAGIVVGGLPPEISLLPLAISAAIVWWARRQPPGTEPGPHVGRLVGIASGVEGLAMFLAANFLINNHHKEAVMPAFAIIVGLHFVPLARGIPVRFYYGTAASLVLLGVVGLLTPLPPLLMGVTAAIVLWASAVALAKGIR